MIQADWKSSSQSRISPSIQQFAPVTGYPYSQILLNMESSRLINYLWTFYTALDR